MGVLLRHPETGGLMETAEINDDAGETQAQMYIERGWERVADDEAAKAELEQRTAALLSTPPDDGEIEPTTEDEIEE